MCGITGIVDYAGNNISSARLRSASDLISHRGPDADGIYIEQLCGLAHKRLSIIDLSDMGRQPMISSDERFVCVFNGELYNFRELKDEISSFGHTWRGDSDTEVLLEAWRIWGPSSLKKFDGMYAFSIWDKKEKKLFAARDRFGEKPFYYYRNNNLFAFCSRPKPLFELLPEISKKYDEQSLRFFLESGYIPAPRSIYENIQKLPAAHYLVLSSEKLEVIRYWDPNGIHTNHQLRQRNENEIIDELDEIITRSVKNRMISDVPLGAFLSGGIDSSLMVAIMAKHKTSPISTFTIGFDEKAYDESAHSQAVADHIGTEHYCENLQVKDLLYLLPDFLKNYDEPFFDSAAFPTMAVSRLAKKHVSVAITGDGGDELFGGYHYYQIIKYLSLISKLPSLTVKLMSSLLQKAPSHSLKLVSAALKENSNARAFAFSRSIAKDFQEVLDKELLARTIGLKDLFEESAAPIEKILHPCEIAMRLDCQYTLNDDYLQKTDVACMAYSLESRAPLLSKEVIEYAMKLPVNYKIGSQPKYILRKLLYRYVPKEIVDRPKRGFGVPIDGWLRVELKDWAYERVSDPEYFKDVPLDQKAVKKLFTLHQTGSRNVHPLLWAILVFLEFHGRNRA